VKRPKAARTSGHNADSLKQRFLSCSHEGPNRVPFARAATGRTFRAASEAAEGRESERPSRSMRLGVTKSA